MSLNNYKKIRINSGGERVLYFDGSGASGTLFPAFADTFDVRINQDDLTNRDLLVTDDTTARVDVQGLEGESIIRIDLKVYSYQLLDEIEADGGTDADEDYSHGVYEALGDYDYSLACSCSQYKTGSLYYGTGSFPAEDYQVVFTDGDKIITGIETETGEWNFIPPKTSRIEIKPFVTAVKLPVRAKDIANDDGEILDTVAIVGSTGSISDRIQYLNNTGVITRIETTEDAPEFRPVKNLGLSAGSYDDYPLPTGTIFGVVGITSPYSVTFTGLRDEGGREVTFISRPGVTITFNHEDSNSDADHRFVLPSSTNVTISEYQTATFVYVTLESRWYMISKT